MSENYEPGADSLEVYEDEDGQPYVYGPDGETVYVDSEEMLQIEEQLQQPAEYFPDQFTPEQAIEELSALPPEGREEFLVKNRPPTVHDPNFEVAARKTREARVRWATARMEAADEKNPNKTQEFEAYLRLLEDGTA